MKRVVSISIILLIITFTVSAVEKDEVWWGSNYMPGNVAIGGTISIESDYWSSLASIPSGGYESGFGVAGQAELLLYKPVFGAISPVDFGVAAKARTGFFFRNYGSSSSEPWFPVGAAVMGTAHFGFKGFDIHFSEFNDSPINFFNILSRFDYFINLGVAFDILNGDSSYGPLGLAGATGVNYFVNDNFMVNAGYNLWNGYSGYYVGGSFKIGPSQKTKDISIDLDILYYQVYLAQFYSVYWYTNYAGGFYFDDSNYKEGQGTEWKLTSSDDNDELIMKKSLLKLNADGSRWWQVKYIDGSDDFIYEFLLDKEYNLLKLKFIDEDTGRVREYTANEDDLAVYKTADMRAIDDSQYKEWKTETVKIKTDAGTFTADHIVHPEEDLSYEWWISSDVPGEMIKYEWKDSEETITGELIDITSGNKSELGGF